MNSKTRKVLIALVVVIGLGGAVFAGNRIMENNRKKAAPSEPIFTGEATVQTVDLYYVLPGDNGKNGQKFGCNDSLVLAKQEIKTSSNIQDTLALLMMAPRRSSNEYYNALAGSQLLIEKYALGAARPATLHLRGTLKQGGACDAPRIEAQLRETVKQFVDTSTGEIPEIKIYINGKPLSKVLSTK
jgi:hypothetical protein